MTNTLSRKVFLCTIIIIAGAFLRFSQLSERPFHADEAVHGIKFEKLLTEGSYNYDPEEFHGPVMYYFSVVPAKIFDVKTSQQLSEKLLRYIPAFFGTLCILLPLILWKRIPTPAIFLMMLLIAIGGGFTYYNRHYIQETIFVFFSFAFLFSFLRFLFEKNYPRAIISGLFLGMAHASKETFIITVFSFILALFLLDLRDLDILKKENIKFLIAGFVSAIVTSFLFYSSFFQNSRGFIDSFVSYSTYIGRGITADIHHHPWFYYLKLFIIQKGPESIIWTDIFLITFSLTAIIKAFRIKTEYSGSTYLIRFISLFCIIQLIIYSLIPYKTPWSIMSVYYGLLVLAGFGIFGFYKSITIKARVILLFVILVGSGHLFLQTYSENFIYHSAPENRWTYSNTSKQVPEVAEDIKKYLNKTVGKKAVIIAEDHDYWPLPWYFRSRKNIGYFGEVPRFFRLPDLVIVSENLFKKTVNELYDKESGKKSLYVPFPKENGFFLRENYKMKIMVKYDSR